MNEDDRVGETIETWPRQEYFGLLSVRLPDGYVQYCVVRESHYVRFLGRLYEIAQLLLESSLDKPIRYRYSGDYAGAVKVSLGADH